MTASGSQVALQERHKVFVFDSASRHGSGDARLTEQLGNEGAGTGPSTPRPILETALFAALAWLADRCSVTSERILEIDQVISGKISSSLQKRSLTKAASRTLQISFSPVTQTHTTLKTKRVNTRPHSRSVVPQSFGEFLAVGFERKVQLDGSGGSSRQC
ncbi:pseudouridine synthase [Pseudozyma hubeiensis SY62]|uniref:Pseudouridine synthase n=1 Tax=Pseudozyma hubeiensis (strain SY62) TaxID=1305764 RepID=R9P1J7_PSEHS|nr:pseudouridine synthase [Pseudozyma hubeiensis SY62]GAC95173.1 pseudouridine synthase [Pseudozyma hubeiensis SY62]